MRSYLVRTSAYYHPFFPDFAPTKQPEGTLGVRKGAPNYVTRTPNVIALAAPITPDLAQSIAATARHTYFSTAKETSADRYRRSKAHPTR